jgi:hypothetical protein
MQDWFNDIGAYGNVTGPNAYRGQTMNFYTGGSLYMRTPVRNYQLASISPPSFQGWVRRNRSLRRIIFFHQQGTVRRTAAEHRQQRHRRRLQHGPVLDVARPL